MIVADLIQSAGLDPESVVLLEGTRNVEAGQGEILATFAAELAKALPGAVLRSGNAPGTDEAFALGVGRAGTGRLQLIVPYAGHRKTMVPQRATVNSMDEVPPTELSVIAGKTTEASHQYAGLVRIFLESGRRSRQGAQAAYLLRDTLKVVGSAALGLAPATHGIFFTRGPNQMSGGTGHTIRVCRICRVAVLTPFAQVGEKK